MALIASYFPFSNNRVNTIIGRNTWNTTTGGIFSAPGPSLVSNFDDLYPPEISNLFPDAEFKNSGRHYDIIRSLGDLAVYHVNKELHLWDKLGSNDYIEWRIPCQSYTWYEFVYSYKNIAGFGHTTQVGTESDPEVYWRRTITTLNTAQIRMQFRTGSNSFIVIRVTLNDGDTHTALFRPYLYALPMGFVQALANIKNWVLNPEFKTPDTAIVANDWVVNGADSGIKYSEGQQIIGKLDANDSAYVGIQTDPVTNPTFATKSLYFYRVKVLIITPATSSVNLRVTVNTSAGSYTHNHVISGTGQIREVFGKPATNVAGYTRIGMQIQTNTFGAKILILGAQLTEFPSGFFTGDYLNCAWDATANASPSQYTGGSILESTAPPFEDIDEGTFLIKFRLYRTGQNFEDEGYLFNYNNYRVSVPSNETINIYEETVGYPVYASSGFTFFNLYMGSSTDGWNSLAITYGKGSYTVVLNGVTLAPATGSSEYNLFVDDSGTSPAPSPELQIGLLDSSYEHLVMHGLSQFCWLPYKISQTHLEEWTTEPYGPRYSNIFTFLESKGYI